MTLEWINEPMSVCRLADFGGIDLNQPYVFAERTPDECSLVCPTRLAPANAEKREDGWAVVSAGPTTSVRENPYEPAFIKSSGVRIIIGKGGMDDATLAAMKKCGCVYVQAVGGAGALYAASVKKVAGVDLLDKFGAAEACWHFEVEGFRGVVAMDAHGNSLFDKVASAADKQLKKIL